MHELMAVAVIVSASVPEMRVAVGTYIFVGVFFLFAFVHYRYQLEGCLERRRYHSPSVGYGIDNDGLEDHYQHHSHSVDIAPSCPNGMQKISLLSGAEDNTIESGVVKFSTNSVSNKYARFVITQNNLHARTNLTVWMNASHVEGPLLVLVNNNTVHVSRTVDESMKPMLEFFSVSSTAPTKIYMPSVLIEWFPGSRSISLSLRNVSNVSFKSNGVSAGFPCTWSTVSPQQHVVPNRHGIIIGILSSARNFHQRSAIRSSWLQYSEVRDGFATARFFVASAGEPGVDASVREESAAFSDIILMDQMNESYRGITRKTLEMCRFVARSQAKFLLKCDDDTYVRVPRVVAHVKAFEHPYIYFGHITRLGKPDRNPNSKWHLPEHEYPGHAFPPFAHGPGYIVSQELCRQIVSGGEKMFPLLPLEDISMAVWVDTLKTVYGYDVHIIDDYRMHAFGCRPDMFIAHYIEPSKMMTIFEQDRDGKSIESLC